MKNDGRVADRVDKFFIREYVDEDATQLDELVALHGIQDPSYRPRDDQKGSEWLKEGLGEQLVKFVAVDEDKVVGHIAVADLPEECEVYQIVKEHVNNNNTLVEIRRGMVHPDWRKKGIGGALSKQAFRWAVKHRYQPVAVTLDNRVDSPAMLAKYGWVIVGKKKAIYSDAYVHLWLPDQEKMQELLASRH